MFKTYRLGHIWEIHAFPRIVFWTLTVCLINFTQPYKSFDFFLYNEMEKNRIKVQKIFW